MTIQLTSDATPTHSIPRETFLSHATEHSYWSVPLEYFDTTTDPVSLQSRLATELHWTIDEHCEDAYNITAIAQTLTLDNQSLSIPAGFFCSYVPHNHVVDR